MESITGASARDYFALFNIEPDFGIDLQGLERAYHTLLSQFHPDRFAGKSQVEQRVAAQLCADINSGFHTLSNEVLRAEYVLKRAGVDLEKAERQGVGADFLMAQITLRERLESIGSGDVAARQALLAEIEAQCAASRDAFGAALQAQRLQDAARHWQEMCYLSKLREAARPRIV